MMDDPARHEVFEALLEEAERARAFPQETLFRLQLEQQRDVIDALVRDGAIRREVRGARVYVPTLAGLRAHRSALAERILHEAAALLPILQQSYRGAPLASTRIPALVTEHGLDPWSVQRSLELLDELPMKRSMQWGADGVFTQIDLDESVLDRSPADVLGTPELDAIPGDAAVTLKRIEIQGYRPFRDFVAEFGSLTVMIGANAAGKSALLDFLRFVGDAVDAPLPPEIDPGSIGKALFHAGGPAKIAWSMTVDMGRLLRYEVEILGPVGAPRVVRERLATVEPADSADARPALFLDFRGGSGTLRDPGRSVMVPASWPAIPNELALRRMIDPRHTAAYRLREAMSNWRVYAGFDVSPESPIRQPAIVDSEPVLAENGSNLSAVLLWLQTEHRDAFAELETHLRSVIPSFRALQVKLMGGRGRAMATWLEDGVAEVLTLADLSDGTLRFLGWATLCLAPNPPSLICMDEPEIGLHPRVLPVLAGLCQRASERTQVLLTTHSPYFLAQFDLDDIAVMRREDGRTVFARPGSSASLRAMIEELGGDELMRMHVSDELETLA